ncbi:TetR family transcriptional regulator [Actinocatenispora sera]|uniref:TetR/AcrR family transcriptional regulator n=1 Tax=Actinocatenispora sera TaxID=390989 RepID=UPI0034002E8A
MARTGRRPGPSHTREDILRSAALWFGARGYEKATIRTIAADAAVDPAMIRRLFGSKDGLFSALVAATIHPSETVGAVLQGPPDRAGDRLVSQFLKLSGPAGRPAPLIGLIRSAVAADHPAALMREFLTEQVLMPIARGLNADRPELRGALCASQLVGLAVSRQVIRLPALQDASDQQLASWLAPVLQHYLTGDLSSDA